MKTLLIKIVFCLLSLTATSAFAQSIVVKGRVIDKSQEGIPGASVLVDGTSIGTISDLDGNYTITAPSSKSSLVYSFIGYATKKIQAGNRGTALVVLEENVNALDEVIVVGFGKQKKVNLTGAIAPVDMKSLGSRATTNLTTGLQGVVGGLNITNDNGGAPGQKMNINIRGIGTIGESSGAGVLTLIDGIEGDLSLLNPEDVESISVLKDAASAAIYGSRAPFGVILVTTKRGQEGKLTIRYNGNMRFNVPVAVPEMLDSYTHAVFSNDANRNTRKGHIFGSGMIDKILAYQEGREIYDSQGKPQNVAWGTGPRGGTIMDDWEWESATWANVDWYDVFLKSYSPSQEHNISLNGGGEKMTYLVSARYYSQGGLFNFVEEKYKTFNINGSFKFNINKYLNVVWNTRMTTESNEKPSAMDDLFFHNVSKLFPTTPMTMPNGDYNYYSHIPSLRNGGQQTSRNQLIQNQLQIELQPIKDWRIYADVAYRIENSSQSRQFKKIYVTQPDNSISAVGVMKGMSGTYKNYNNGSFEVYPAAGDSWLEEMNGRVNYVNSNARTDYEFKLKKHSFKVLAGMQLEYYGYNRTRVGSTGIISDDMPFIPTDTENNKTLKSNKIAEWSTLGFFGRLNYSYADRYLVELNVRADGASRFPPHKRWGQFTSFSAGWNIAQESFFENLRLAGFDMFKLRGSFGALGNQNMQSWYPYFPAVNPETPAYVINGIQAQGLPPSAPISNDITWETVQTLDFGVDLAVFNGRLTATFDWFNRTNKDIVGPALSLPGIYGATVPQTNNARLVTKGFEVEIGWRDRIGKDWEYGINATLSDYKSVVDKYESPTGEIKDDKFYKGKNLGEIWGYKVHGMAKSDNEMFDWLATHDQTAISTVWGGGDFMYEDLDGNKKIESGSKTIYNHGDLTVIGNTTPRYQFGLRGTLRWKFLDLNVFFQGIGKRDIYIDSATFDGIGDEYQRPTTKEHLNYFRYADHEFGANFDSYYARPRTDNGNNVTNDYYLQNAAYIRLKNLTIGYTLPNTSANKVIKGLRVYFTGENLFTFTNLKVYDPESFGLSSAPWGLGKTYPMFKTFSVGLTLTL